MCRFRSLLALVAAQLICSGSGVSIHTPVGGPNDAISYKRLLVDSLIVSRFAVTTVTSVIRNNANESKGLDFQVQLPESAFVSKFTMQVITIPVLSIIHVFLQSVKCLVKTSIFLPETVHVCELHYVLNIMSYMHKVYHTVR